MRTHDGSIKTIATVTGIGYVLGEEWSDATIGTETWTEVSASSDTWTEQIGNTNIWQRKG